LGTVVPIAVTLGMVFPAVLGAAYGDVMGGFIYASLALYFPCQLVWVYAITTNAPTQG
jgi:hypothetical protein